MSKPSFDQHPVLKAGCRLSPPSGTESLLLIPEGALKLQGPSRRILELCNGQRDLGAVIVELCREFPATEPERIGAEVAALLESLRERGAVEFL